MKPRKFNDIKRSNSNPERAARVQRRVEEEILDLNLSELRSELGLTQAQVAAAAEMTQGELSRLEHRSDHLVSTLRRCVRALGGELELTAVIGNRKVLLKV